MRQEFVNVPVGSAEMLPCRTCLTYQLDSCLPQLLNGPRQISDREAHHGAGVEVFFARVLLSKDFYMISVRQFEDPEVRLGVDQSQPEHILVEPCLRLSAVGAYPTPAQLSDIHSSVWRRRSSPVRPSVERLLMLAVPPTDW